APSLGVELAEPEVGLGGVDGGVVVLGDALVVTDGLAVVAGFLGFAGLVHVVEGVAAVVGGGDAGEHAAFNTPAVDRVPDQIGLEGGRAGQQRDDHDE